MISDEPRATSAQWGITMHALLSCDLSMFLLDIPLSHHEFIILQAQERILARPAGQLAEYGGHKDDILWIDWRYRW
jgi:hypothetical protein